MSKKINKLQERKRLLWNTVKPLQGKLERGGSLTTSENEIFKNVDYEIRGIDTLITNMREPSFGDVNSGKRARLINGKKYTRNSDDERFTSFLRGKSPQPEFRSEPEFRATLDANSLSTGGVEPGIAGGGGYSAGYMIPQGFWANLQIAIKAYGGTSNGYRQVITDTGNPMPWPTVDPTGIKASYITETSQVGFGGDSAGTDYQFGQGMLNAWTIVSGVILASLQLVEDSAFDVDSFVADRIGESLGRKIAAEAITGTGSTAALGIMTALNAKGAVTTSGGYYGLTAAKTVPVFGNYSSPTLTELVGNVLAPASLLGMVQGIDPAYLPNAMWYLNPALGWNLRSITDANGRPIVEFMAGFDADNVTSPDYSNNAPVAKLFGFPVILDANIPVLTASTCSGAIFGDMSRAMVMRQVRGDARVVANTGAGNVMRLTERYADYLQVGYLGYLRFDCRSNDLRAAVCAKPAGT